MTFNKNTRIAGQHAFLSPSKPHWLDYDEDKLIRVFHQSQATAEGTARHAYAQMAITLKIKQADNGSTMSQYVNDAIGFQMTPEVNLFYSENCFGTADAIGIRVERGTMVLRISDLKTGVTPAHMKQLLIYAGIFFHEYRALFDYRAVVTILRIYQNDAIEEHIPDTAELSWVMSQIRNQAERVARLREED